MNQRNLLQRITIILACLLPTVSNASVITQSLTTADLQGYHWLSLDETASMSRVDVEASALMTSDGWRYATRAETETLINSLWGGTYDGYSSDNAPGALDFLSTWGSLTSTSAVYVNSKISNFYFGNRGECGGINTSCAGIVRHYDNAPHSWLSQNISTGQFESSYVPNSGPVGFFADKQGGDFGVTSLNNAAFHTNKGSSYGSLLVRDPQSVPISLPPTLMLFLFAVLGLTRARKRPLA